MINKRAFQQIHGAGQSQQEIDRRWLLFEQEQAAFAQQYMMPSSGAGVGGGAGDTLTFYGYGFIDPWNGFFTGIDAEGNVNQIGNTEFYGTTVFCRNPDDGKMYYISQDTTESEMVIGTIDPTTGVVTEIDRAILSEEYYAPPCSLVYIGGNNFMYLGNNLFFGGEGPIQKAIEIQISGETVVIGTSFTLDTEDLATVFTTIFPLNGGYWFTGYPTFTSPFGVIGEIDLETPVILSGTVMGLENFPFADSYKIIFSVGISQSASGKIYFNSLVVDKDTDVSYLVISEADPEDYTNTLYVQNISLSAVTPTDIEIV